MKLVLGALATVVLMGALPGVASAASVFHMPDDGGNLNYEAGPGEDNDVTVKFIGASYEITDAGVGEIQAGVGCVAVGNVATCPAAEWLQARLGDRDDQLRIESTGPGLQYVEIQGGDGSDRISTAGVPATVGAGIPGRTVRVWGDELGLTADGDDELIDGPASAALMGMRGSDVIRGGSGNDELWGNGDPDDQFSGIDGDDKVYGEGGNDILSGGPGNDLVVGGTGNDLVDAHPWHTGGADTLVGGPGADRILGREGAPPPPGIGAAPVPNAIDQISCGPGPDIAHAGPQDLVSADCETILQEVTCPGSAAGSCEGTASVTAIAGGAGASALARDAAQRRRLTLGVSRPYRIRPGRTRSVRIVLRRKPVRRVLRNRSRARATAVAPRRVGTRKLKPQRTGFVLRKR